jgi:hypothetical protein
MAPQRSTETLFVDSQLGELPLLLTCSHDGRGAPPGLQVRSDEPQPGCGRVRTDADLFTRRITLGLAAAVEDLTAQPFSVIARFRRRFIDANREAKCAFDSQAAKPFYDEYHRRITLGIAAIKRTFPNRGLLVDIHGAADQDDPGIHVLLGTDNRESLKRLLALDEMILWRRGGPVRRLQASRRPGSAWSRPRPTAWRIRTSTGASPFGATAPPARPDSTRCRSRSCAASV